MGGNVHRLMAARPVNPQPLTKGYGLARACQKLLYIEM